MASWIYLFSKFTPEALLFELLFIFTLCASYAAFWILKKRKYGVLGPQPSTNLVKGVLTELIVDAEQLRIQLFGLLAGDEIPAVSITALRVTGGSFAATTPVVPMTAAPADSSARDPHAVAQLAALEAAISEQAQAMEEIVADKARLETELAAAKVSGSKAGAPNASAGNSELQEKIKMLEAKLAEYSVIEDDLANLKRLQQENAQLKAQLATKGSTAATPLAAAPVAAMDPTAAAQATADAALEAAMAAQEAAPAAPTAATPAPVAPAPVDDSVNFEALVDQVEKSIQQAPAAAPVMAAPAAPAPAAAPTPPPAATPAPPPPAAKSDADLVAEFEKMLNS
ncbi:hypothetical protein WDW37_02560 [Bdellovibrionota bacterium FG-1]